MRYSSLPRGPSVRRARVGPRVAVVFPVEQKTTEAITTTQTADPQATESPPCVTVTAPPELDVTSVGALFEALDVALLARPAVLRLDFGQTTFCASDGVYVVASAAIGCHALGVSLCVIESPSVGRLLDVAGLSGADEWHRFARRVAVDRPSRLSYEGFQAAAGSLCTSELVAARSACCTSTMTFPSCS